MPVIDGVVTVLPAPAGYVVDFDHPQRRGVPEAYWIAGAGTILSIIFMARRIYTKMFLTGGLTLDDLFLGLAWLTSTTTTALCLHMFAHAAGGVHAWEISVEKYNMYMLDVYLASAIYATCGSFAKMSLLSFYLKLSPERWFRWCIWATICIIIGYSIGIFFSLLFACSPIAMSWNVTITTGTCINRAALYITTAVANIVTDVILFILPIPMLVRLQIPLAQKIGLALIFTIGSLTVVTSIVRLSILPPMLTDPDQPWVISFASVWIIVEANLLIICAALPTLRKFLRHVAPKLIGESTYGKGSKKPTGVSGGPSSLVTYGGSNHRDDRSKYAKFDRDNDGNERYHMTTIEASGGNNGGTGTGTKSAARSSETDVAWVDDDSAKAIVRGTGEIIHTTTVTVEFEDALKKSR